VFDPHTDTLWVTNGSGIYSGVDYINDTTYTEASSVIKTGNGPVALAFDPHTDSIWVANNGSSTVTQINDTTYATTTYSVGSAPIGIAFDSHNNTIWVTNENSNSVTVLTPSH
jgi:DNA-binding beta-propeller fold protein YncE